MLYTGQRDIFPLSRLKAPNMSSFLSTVKSKLGLGKSLPVPEQKLLDETTAKSAMMSQTSSPLPRHAAQLIEAYGATPSLRSVVGKIASSTASTAWHLYAQRGATRTRAVRNLPLQRAGWAGREKGLNDLSADKELEEIVEHPFLSILHAPNDMMTGLAAREVMQVHLELAGEAFMVVFRNNQGAPNSAIVLSPTSVTDLPSESDPTFKVKLGYDKVWSIPVTEVLWFRTVNPADLYGRGSGFAAALADELDIAEYSAKQISSFFWNQAMPNFIVSVDGAGKAGLKRAQKEWEQSHQGFAKSYRAKWTSGKLDVKRLDTSFRDMNIVELRKHSRDVIAQTWGVPPEILGIVENSNRATITAAEYIYAQQVLCPRLEAARETMQRFVEREYDDRLILHYDSPVPSDKDFQLQAMQAQPAAYTANEWRSISGHPSKDSGEDTYFLPSGVTVVDELEAVEDNSGSKGKSKSIKKQLVNAQDIDLLLSYLSADVMREMLGGLVDDVAEDFGSEMLDSIDSDVVFNLQNPLVRDEVQVLMFDRIDGITDTTRQTLRAALVEGVFAGESIDQIASRIQNVFVDMGARRAQSIAQNSVHQIANAANHSAMVQSGIVERKQWVTSFVRSRETHVNLHGQVRFINEPFVSSSGATAMHPHGFGEASEDVGCRCTEVAVIVDPKSIEALDKIAEQKEADLAAWDRMMTRAVRKAFRAQRDDLLDALKGFA